ncbi:MAG TPA: hypothetical protein VGW12_04990 [Pyrinomonadaceae bacterium]|nr:hypothetical protein [Pyrinomonadaceae bacterium]
MTEHLSPQTIHSFAERTLEPRDVLKAARHIAACEACRRQISEAQPLLARVRSLHDNLQDASLHLDYDEMEGYADGKLVESDREAADSHLSMCHSCAEEVRELISLRDNLDTYPSVSDATDAMPNSRRASLRQRLFAFLSFEPQRLGWALAAIVIVAVVGLVLWRQKPVGQVAVVPETKSSPTISAPASPDSLRMAERGTASDAVSSARPPDMNNPPQSAQRPSESEPRSRVVAPVAVNAGQSLLSSYEGIIRRAMISQSVSPPAALRGLDSKSSVLMGGAGESTGEITGEATGITLLSPVRTVVRTVRPNFRWLPVGGATVYRVVILDPNFNVLIESGPLTETTWSPPRPLGRGGVYLWQVTARQGEREITSSSATAKEARFKILSPSEERKIRRLAQVTPHLELGLIYAHHGLLDEAEREFRFSLKENRQAAMAKKLIASLQRLRR